jgi:uncharacterized membrane protein HdeD (DUF308 family)
LELTHSYAVATQSHTGGGTWFLLAWSLIAIVIGSANAVNPQLAYRVNRWQYKNKQAFEPSAAGLMFARAIGGLFVVIGIVCLVVAVTKL